VQGGGELPGLPGARVPAQIHRSEKMTKYIYSFGPSLTEGDGSMKDLLGGKGAGLAEMSRAGMPVPPGFTITTEVCRLFYERGGRLPEGFQDVQDSYLRKIEEVMGKKLGDPADPLLLSVRSGAKFSMPGMMDTILNLGLNDETVKALAERTGNERFAYDCYRRLIQMFGNVVMGVERDEFERVLAGLKSDRGYQWDTELTADDLKYLAEEFKKILKRLSGRDFPQDPRAQLDLARDAVFRSWNNERARYYRKQNGIPDSLGTAVNVQVMVFGNLSANSGTGVGFTRNPSTGEREFYGEYLMNAQGEDVVAGVRTPSPISELERELPEVFAQLKELTAKLERHYRDMQDFEFTIQDGKLFMLQTRTGKRTPQAAVRIAVEMVGEGLIDERQAVLRVSPEELVRLLHRRVDHSRKLDVVAKGMGASPGAATGEIVFDPDTAVKASSEGRKVILVRKETSSDDIHGMDAAEAVLTATGGMTSHAAVVARGMGKCCVVGCGELEIDEAAKKMTVAGKTLGEGEVITVDGSTGEVILGEAPTIEASTGGELEQLLSWADRFRRLGVRANADTGADAARARSFGAEGIGLCRTEHMFFDPARLPLMREMILASDEKGRRAALEELLPFQKNDFKEILRAMEGLPVTIRTLDPPLHEFLPSREDLILEIERAKAGEDKGDLQEKKDLLEKVNRLHEFNPMLGHRGCRLTISYPEVIEMQARAILEAACELEAEGVKVFPEIMIPLVGDYRELRIQRETVERTARRVMEEKGVSVEFKVGTMIEVPRAALTAGEIALEADFFSFGTNDLTQMAYGFSRDDAVKFLPLYLEKGLVDKDPFVSIDEAGVGRLIRMCIEDGRSAKPGLKIGICGEQGGEPDSVAFCHRSGLDYVSCSPFRVPVARLSAAHAALREAVPAEAVSK